MRSSVDLPQPDGPTSTVNSPSAMSNEMPWITFVVPKDFSTFLNDTEAMVSHALSSCHSERSEESALSSGSAAHHKADPSLALGMTIRERIAVMISPRRR